LREEFLEPLGMTQAELAQRIRVPYVRVNELVNGKRRVTPSTALRLAKAFGTSPEFWLNGQLALDLYRVVNDKQETEEVEKIEPVLH
jgi:addiction module HigA family antidote